MMHIDARTLDDRSSLCADICIIGAGAAGITIAMELRNSVNRVVLIESGGFDQDSETQSLYEGETAGLHYVPLAVGRLRFFGGTTGHWAGWCAPLDPIDFEKREWIQSSGWPITHADLEPWYQRAQELCQLGPFRYQVDYWERQISSSLRLVPSSGKIDTKIIQLSPPTRFGDVYRREIVEAENIVLWTHANVTDIRSNASTSHITGLEVTTLTKKRIFVAASQYVLACGGTENARILLLSNKVNKRGLGNQYDLVGRYLMDHTHVDTSGLILPGKSKNTFYRQPWTPMARRRFIPLVGMSPTVQRGHQIGNYSAVIVTEEANSVEDDRRVGTTLQRQVASQSHSILRLNARIEQMPNPNSRIMLSEDKKDALGQPRVRSCWQLTGADKRTIRVAERVIADELGRTQLGRLQMPDWLLEEGEQWPEVLGGGFHHMGTTRMSDNPRLGVVGPDCRIHGIDNLYVAGSSVFPTSGTANPTMTVVALAARLASHLKYRSRP